VESSILAGGFAPGIVKKGQAQPMVEIGGNNSWNIMEIYSTHGINDFVNLLRLTRAHDQGIFSKSNYFFTCLMFLDFDSWEKWKWKIHRLK